MVMTRMSSLQSLLCASNVQMFDRPVPLNPRFTEETAELRDAKPPIQGYQQVGDRGVA